MREPHPTGSIREPHPTGSVREPHPTGGVREPHPTGGASGVGASAWVRRSVWVGCVPRTRSPLRGLAGRFVSCQERRTYRGYEIYRPRAGAAPYGRRAGAAPYGWRAGAAPYGRCVWCRCTCTGSQDRLRRVRPTHADNSVTALAPFILTHANEGWLLRVSAGSYARLERDCKSACGSRTLRAACGGRTLRAVRLVSAHLHGFAGSPA